MFRCHKQTSSVPFNLHYSDYSLRIMVIFTTIIQFHIPQSIGQKMISHTVSVLLATISMDVLKFGFGGGALKNVFILMFLTMHYIHVVQPKNVMPSLLLVSNLRLSASSMYTTSTCALWSGMHAISVYMPGFCHLNSAYATYFTMFMSLMKMIQKFH